MSDTEQPSRAGITDAFCELVEIVHRLRAPGGCPWDREQTPKTLKTYVIEEAYEVCDAIDSEKPEEIREELGDLLLQVVLQAEIGSETGSFELEGVIRGLSEKLVYRHPHVFGEIEVDGSGEVLKNWEQLKKKEKGERGLFDGLPKQLPALQRASRVGEKAARVGFDWTSMAGARDKVAEELAELDEAVSTDSASAIESELGDVLFAIAQWARHLGVNPEEALRTCCRRFTERFRKMESALVESGSSLTDASLDEMESAWQQAKRA